MDIAAKDSTHLLRLVTDEATARRVADFFTEMFDPEEIATAAFESGERWAVEVHFAHTPNRDAMMDLLRVAVGAVAGAAQFEVIARKDWVAASLEGLAPVRVGRFVIHGAHDRSKVAPNRVGIEIEAALAFGTGHHGTTQGCLAAIERVMRERRRPRRILDLGTGTGVLAMAAARGLRRKVIASDCDPVAIRTARENARINQAGNFIRFVHAKGTNAPPIREGGRYDFVLANILLPTLRGLAGPLLPLLAPGAVVVLSGLLAAQAGAALAVWRAHGLRLVTHHTIEGWTTLTLRRP